jgi:DNA primase large subunit
MSNGRAKVAQPFNHYTPTYARAPRLELSYDEVVDIAEQRHLFHERLSFESQQRHLDYRDLRTLSVIFGVPIKKLSSNSSQLRQDRVSFYCLLMVSLRNEEIKLRFVRNEGRLFLYRLRSAGISILQLTDYFWTDISLRDSLIAGYRPSETGGFFRLPFERGFDFFPPSQLAISEGFACLSQDDVYQIVSQMFTEKLKAHIEKQGDSIRRNGAALSAFSETFSKRIQPKRPRLISLENLDKLSARSFPPCMFRILNVLKQFRTLTFKAQFELSLVF